MKPFFAAALLTLLLAIAPASAQTGTVAIGPVYSISFLGLSDPLGGLGVTGKIPGLAPIWGLNFILSNKESKYFVGVTADWILYKQPLYAPFNINFYLGPGFYSSLRIDSVNDSEAQGKSASDLDTLRKNQASRFDLGLRIPFGVSWTPVKFLEVFTELTPAFGVTFQDPVQPSWVAQAAVGGRIWF